MKSVSFSSGFKSVAFKAYLVIVQNQHFAYRFNTILLLLFCRAEAGATKYEIRCLKKVNCWHFSSVLLMYEPKHKYFHDCSLDVFITREKGLIKIPFLRLFSINKITVTIMLLLQGFLLKDFLLLCQSDCSLQHFHKALFVKRIC